MTTVADASYVSAEDWAAWERDREARNREYAATLTRPVRTTRADLEAQLHALRVFGDERVVALGRRVAELERLLDQAWRACQALRNDERVA